VRILIAEDETIIRLDLRALLEKSGLEVCAEARDGAEAVELARSEQPDLAIMDVKMPRLDGIEAARRILDERPIPIVMLTAYGQDELVSRAVEAGVFGYLVKPFRESDLLPAIATARARHEELVALREEAESLSEALAARKVIERAKGLLMAKEGLTESEAFDRLRRASQVSGRPLKDRRGRRRDAGVAVAAWQAISKRDLDERVERERHLGTVRDAGRKSNRAQEIGSCRRLESRVLEQPGEELSAHRQRAESDLLVVGMCAFALCAEPVQDREPERPDKVAVRAAARGRLLQVEP
jgi:response regulator NasT